MSIFECKTAPEEVVNLIFHIFDGSNVELSLNNNIDTKKSFLRQQIPQLGVPVKKGRDGDPGRRTNNNNPTLVLIGGWLQLR